MHLQLQREYALLADIVKYLSNDAR